VVTVLLTVVVGALFTVVVVALVAGTVVRTGMVGFGVVTVFGLVVAGSAAFLVRVIAAVVSAASLEESLDPPQAAMVRLSAVRAASVTVRVRMDSPSLQSGSRSVTSGRTVPFSFRLVASGRPECSCSD
jgi:hypothetical protein